MNTPLEATTVQPLNRTLHYRAYSKDGSCAIATTPEAARDLFFQTYPKKRKCVIYSCLPNDDGTFVTFYKSLRSWQDVTRKSRL